MCNWISANHCYCRLLDDNVFAFIGVRPQGDSYVVCHKIVDLRDYDRNELVAFMRPYGYKSIAQVFNQFHGDANLVVARCVFSAIGLEQMDFCAERRTLSDADAFTLNWMNDFERIGYKHWCETNNRRVIYA